MINQGPLDQTATCRRPRNRPRSRRRNCPRAIRGFDVVDGSTRVIVPSCFVTDFSSIPAFARALYRCSTVDLAGVCHDGAYRMGVDRKTADRCWEIVATSGDTCVGATQGRLGYQALRLGGRWAYRGIRSKREGGIITDPQTGAVYLPALAVSRPGRAEAAFACARSTISVFSERTRRPFASTSRSLRSARRSMTARISRPLAHPTRVIAK